MLLKSVYRVEEERSSIIVQEVLNNAQQANNQTKKKKIPFWYGLCRFTQQHCNHQISKRMTMLNERWLNASTNINKALTHTSLCCFIFWHLVLEQSYSSWSSSSKDVKDMCHALCYIYNPSTSTLIYIWFDEERNSRQGVLSTSKVKRYLFQSFEQVSTRSFNSSSCYAQKQFLLSHDGLQTAVAIEVWQTRSCQPFSSSHKKKKGGARGNFLPLLLTTASRSIF